MDGTSAQSFLGQPPAEPAQPDIDSLIVTVRNHRVILAPALAAIYGVRTKALNQAVKRNFEKFPADFMFQLTRKELDDLSASRSQTVTLKRGQNIKYLPYAFTEHGAIMAANVLNSPQATQMNVFVVRAFVKMRSVLTDNRELAQKLAQLEQELKIRLNIHEAAIVEVLQRIMRVLDPPPPPPLPPAPPPSEIGFHVREGAVRYHARTQRPKRA